MPWLLSLRTSPHSGPALIAAGLCVVLVAQVVAGVPIAAAMMLIGCGATQIRGISRSQLSIFANLVVYATLVCFAIASQTHSALSGPASRVGLLLWADHFAALVLLAVTAIFVIGRLGAPTVLDR